VKRAARPSLEEATGLPPTTRTTTKGARTAYRPCARPGSAENHAEAETCFHQALDIARRQQARSLELRAAMSLGRLWQRQGKRAAAYELLSAIYGWFSEGFENR
jgi:hypothetical protein